MDQKLRERRGDLERQWLAGVAEQDLSAPGRPEVLDSWHRSALSVDPGVASAPTAEPDDVTARWAESRIGRASRAILDDLTDLASNGDMMAAITDDTVTIAWIAGGRTMSRRAERVHFTVGGCWAEDAVGTNALALAHKSAHPAQVFSAEHFAPMVHDWVCYSAPILDPESGRFLGVIDLSTVWSKANPALLTTVSALARCVEYELSAGLAITQGAPGAGEVNASTGTQGLALRTLGTPAVFVDGQKVAVSRRQLEILTVLSLHPAGLNLDELIGRVYGDRPVSASTVKAELSHMRQVLGGRISSRPYRLVGPVTSDHESVLGLLTAGDVATAVGLYAGSMLPTSDSPDIGISRNHIDVALRDAVLRSEEAELLWSLSSRCSDDAEVHAAALASLDPHDSRRSIVAGRLAAARMG
jgi:hypothetical protein